MNGRTEVSLRSDGCAAGGHGSDVRRVEHVQAVVSLTSSRRGHVELYLTSPGGTRSTLLSGRRGSRSNTSNDNCNVIAFSFCFNPPDLYYTDGRPMST